VNLDTKKIIARKYAQAYMHVYEHDLTETELDKLIVLKKFISVQSAVLFFLTATAIEDVVKMRGITSLVEKFSLCDSFKKLMFLLFMNRRIDFLPLVIDGIFFFYNKKRKIETFSITSSHVLMENELRALQQFLINNVGGIIFFRHTIDKQLIAGIRMLSDTHLWEYSIAKQLRAVQLLVHV